MRFRAVAIMTLAALVGGCAHQKEGSADADRWKKTDEAVAGTLQKSVKASAAKSGITHVVLFWLKTPGDAAQRRQLIDATYGLQSIPGVTLISVGTAVPSTRPVVDSSFDVSLVMHFADEAALHAYEQHPDHLKAVNGVLRPLSAKTVVYDIHGEPPSKKEAGGN